MADASHPPTAATASRIDAILPSESIYAAQKLYHRLPHLTHSGDIEVEYKKHVSCGVIWSLIQTAIG